MSGIRIFLTFLTLLISPTGFAAGLLTPATGDLPALEIRQHHVEVTIENGYAVTSVDQVFHNPHDATLEAIYSFPIPEKAAVGEFTYWIDGKPVTGEVLEKKRARQVYEQEKAQGRETALVEQDAFKAFDISVYPVLPRQDVKIRMVYLQPVHTDLGIGRYVYPLEEGGVDEEKMAFWSYNDQVTEAFSFNLKLRSSHGVEALRLPQHPQAQIGAIDAKEWQVSLSNGLQGEEAVPSDTLAAQAGQGGITPASFRLDQDIVVYWRHPQGLPGSVDMVTYKPEQSGRGTFMLTITPGDDLRAIEEGRDWSFVLDYSGSMNGKYQSLAEGVRSGLLRLEPKDRFRLVTFNDYARSITSGYVQATPENVEKSLAKLLKVTPSGGTNLYAGVKKSLKGLDSDRSSAVILVTDGAANVGTTEKKAFLKLLEQHDVRLFTFVMGNSANRPLLEGMAKVSNGFAMNVSNSDDILGKLVLATNKLTHEAFHDIDLKMSGKGLRVADLTPAQPGSLYRGQQLTVFGHYWGEGVASVEFSGKVSGVRKEYRTQFDMKETNSLNPELERLWAFASIEDLQAQADYLGEDNDVRQARIDLAVEYGLVTNDTSMVVVREEVFQDYDIDRLNSQRVATEQQARQQRASQGVRESRKDVQQPMFNNTRAYPGSGGGSVHAGMLLALMLLWVGVRLRNRLTHMG